MAQAIIEQKNKFTPEFNQILENHEIEIQFLGLIAFQNPIRLSVPEAIFKCRRAGIKVIMITADHPSTALSIAETAGIVLQKHAIQSNIDEESEESRRYGQLFAIVNKIIVDFRLLFSSSSLAGNILTGFDLANMKNFKLRDIIFSNTDIIFARISLEDKLRIVNCCRQAGAIVAVTGVSTSDIPIFDQSHVRISLGEYGSDIIKSSSDVILLKDNFSSIVHGIQEGRVLFENIKKSVCYTLSSKPAELFPYILYLALAIPQMNSSIIILAIDLLTDNLPPIALGYERAETHVMKGYPRHMRKDKVINFE